MSRVTPLGDRPLSARRALDRIKRLWNGGATYMPGHVLRRMEQRRIDTNDIEHMIRYGRVVASSRPFSGGATRFTDTPSIGVRRRRLWRSMANWWWSPLSIGGDKKEEKLRGGCATPPAPFRQERRMPN
jgi:hypothetical protein